MNDKVCWTNLHLKHSATRKAITFSSDCAGSRLIKIESAVKATDLKAVTSFNRIWRFEAKNSTCIDPIYVYSIVKNIYIWCMDLQCQSNYLYIGNGSNDFLGRQRRQMAAAAKIEFALKQTNTILNTYLLTVVTVYNLSIFFSDISFPLSPWYLTMGYSLFSARKQGNPILKILLRAEVLLYSKLSAYAFAFFQTWAPWEWDTLHWLRPCGTSSGTGDTSLIWSKGSGRST